MKRLEKYDESGHSAALCLITVTKIEPSETHPLVHLTIEKIYKSTTDFDYQELDIVTACDWGCSWREKENGEYSVMHGMSSIPISREGYQYIAFLVPLLKMGSVVVDENFDFKVEALTIPINEDIEDEEYVKGWYESLKLETDIRESSEQFIRTFYKSSDQT